MRDFTPLDFEPSAIPAPDHVLITHGHYDHLDTDSLAQLPAGTHVICPPGYSDILDEVGCATGPSWTGTTATATGSVKSSSCVPTTGPCATRVAGPNTGLWGSYLVRSASGPTVYISGDTAYFDGFRQIGEEFDIDIAVFNVGAYEPRLAHGSKPPQPRRDGAGLPGANARRLMIMHWGTFQLGDEPCISRPGTCG